MNTKAFNLFNKTGYRVRQIHREDALPFILEIHYAHRIPSISYAYGLFNGNELVGVVTYGKPPSPTLRKGVCGESYEQYVIELNRLVLKYNRKNEASMLVGRSLKMLPKPKIVISYADTEQEHIGYVYQATNFWYCGLSADRTDVEMEGSVKHNISIIDEFRGNKHRMKLLREKYGNKIKDKKRSRKHRYIIPIGDKRFKKAVKKCLRYDIMPYPKKRIR